MYQIIAYIKFLLKSTNHHGVHSPFVYDLVTKCFYDTTKYEDYQKLKEYQTFLKSSKEDIEIRDLGEGSKKLNKTKRRISDMAKTSGSSFKISKLLFRLTQYFQFKTMLELGTSLGIATQALALGNPKGQVITVDGCPNTSDYSKTNFQKLDINNTIFLKGDFTIIIPTLSASTLDFVFFDGHHNKTATLQYFNSLLPKIHNDTVFVFDDIYWSKGMTEAWEQIKNHENVTVSIDVFHMGIVFFRKEQAKEHFKIRV